MRASNRLVDVGEAVACEEIDEAAVDFADELRAFEDHAGDELNKRGALANFLIGVHRAEDAAAADDGVATVGGCVEMRDECVGGGVGRLAADAAFVDARDFIRLDFGARALLGEVGKNHAMHTMAIGDGDKCVEFGDRKIRGHLEEDGPGCGNGVEDGEEFFKTRRISEGFPTEGVGTADVDGEILSNVQKGTEGFGVVGDAGIDINRRGIVGFSDTDPKRNIEAHGPETGGDCFAAIIF